MCTAAMQDSLPDFMTNLDNTSVSFPGKQKPKPISAVDVPLGDGFAGGAKNSILERRERMRKIVGE